MRTPNDNPTRARRLAVVAALTLALPLAAGAQKGATLDRTKVPPAGPLPALQVPKWTTMQLADGATLIVSEKHDLPLVSFTIAWEGGADQYEPAGKTGLANIVATMLSEGTTHRSGDSLSADLQLLGTSINTGIGGESGQMGFVSMTQKLEPTLAILEDMLVNPTFPADALERLRARTLVGLQQSRDRTAVIASNVFRKTLYGTEHPYGRYATESTIKSITRDDVVAFHKAYFTPGHAIITVVGDVKPNDVKAMVEKVLAPWTGTSAAPSFAYPTVATPHATTIYVVDKPGAAQSSFAIGLTGPARNTPDYYAIEAMNTILGGMFQSRLNADIREQKGYSYGVSSRFAFGKGPGAFQAGGEIVTAKSDSALLEFMKHLNGIRGDIPVTDDELATAKSKLVQQLPERFSSVESTAGSITGLYLEGLPPSFYQDYQKNVDAVTKSDLERVAKQYIDPQHLAIVVVGDVKTIGGPLKALNIAPVVLLDLDGNPAATPQTP